MRTLTTGWPIALWMAINLLASSPGNTQPGVLEEIIVTAGKRESSLQDAPISVSAFSGDELERSLINNILDIQMSVPNLLMSKGFFSTAQISIRGIGNLGIGSATDTGTGVHFNGVFLNNPRIFETEFFDTERVEVLRGPQGTLYGRNTTAGVVNVISPKPDEDFGGDLQLSLGNFEAIKAKGAINIPLGDNWGQRFAVFYSKRDGFVDNEYEDEDVDDRDMYALRSTTVWRGSKTDATFIVNHMKEDSSRMRGHDQKCLKDTEGIIGCVPTGLANESVNGAATVTGSLTSLVGLTTGQPFPTDDYANSVNFADPRKQNFDFTPRYEVDDTIVSLEINHEIGHLTLTSLTGYHSSDLDARNDFDFTVASEPWPVSVTTDLGLDGSFTGNRAYGTDRSTTKPEQWSQEIRLLSEYDGNWNFLLGGFWMDYESENHYYVYSSSVEVYGETFGIAPSQRLLNNETNPYELDTWALFGEIYWEASEKINYTLGLRYTDEEKSSSQRVVYLNFLDDPTAPDGGFSDFDGQWDEVTGKFNVSYFLDDATMLYTTLSRSYKSGGFNPISAESNLLNPEFGGDPGNAFFDPEYINAIEIGSKSQLLDGALQVNATYFYYDYEDLQVSKLVLQTSLNQNVDDSTIQGIETELIWVPTQHWRLRADAAWLDTKIKSFESVDPANINQKGTTENILSAPNANIYTGPGCPGGAETCDGLPYDLSGNQLPNAPEFSVNLSVAYLWRLSNGLELTISSSYYWQDSYYTRVFNAPNDEIDEWKVWNASLLLGSIDEEWIAEGWIRNIQNEDNVTGQTLGDQVVGLATAQFLLEPRTYGLTLGFTF